MKLHTLYIYIILVLFSLLPFSLSAQTVKIGGVITDEAGEPIELATVRVEGMLVGAVSNLKGKYALTFQSRDTVTVIYSMLGYQTRKRTLHKPKGNISINMVLPVADYELSEVTITERRRQTSSFQQLDAQSSKLMPDASGNAIESMISMQAGVSSRNELSSQYNVRGGSFDENMVYVNGIEIYRPLLIRSGEQEGLSFLNSDMVSTVNFSTGGYDAKFGDKMSSVLDITYKKVEKTEGSARLSLLGGSAYAGVSAKNLSWTHGIRYKSNSYLLGTLDTKGEYDPRYIDYQTYLNWAPSKQWEIQIIGNISENKYNFKPEDRETRFGTLSDIKKFKVYFEGKERDIFRTFIGSGSLTYHAGENHQVTLQASAFKTKEQETYDITGQYWLSDLGSGEDEEESENIGIGTYMEHARNYLNANVQTYTLSGLHRIERHALRWGVEMKREEIKETLKEWEMRDSTGYSMPHVPDGPQLTYSLSAKNHIKSNRFSFYAQDTYRFQSGLGLFSLTAGVRGSYWDWNEEFIFSPRASLSLIPKANEQFTFRLATGVYYQAPFYKEFRDTITVDGTSYASLNKNIKSQRSIHFVAGGDYNFHIADRPFRFTTELYYKALSNLVPYNIDNLRISYYGYNCAKGYVTGLDMKLFGEFVPGTDSWLSLSLMKTKEKINGRWLPRPTDQSYNISLFFTDYFPGSKLWKMNLKANLAGGLPFGTPHGGREESLYRSSPYKRVDIGMYRCLLNNNDKSKHGKFSRYFRNIWLGVEVFNLLDMSNTSSYYWVSDYENNQFAVPNYLTSRQINVSLTAEF